MICLKERVTEYSIGALPVVKIENIIYHFTFIITDNAFFLTFFN